MARRILIVSASMGAGHDGAANELAERLDAQGHAVRVVDFLDCCPFGIGWFIRWTYRFQLRVAPWSYELTYRLWYKLPSTWGFIVRLDTFVAGKRLRRAIADADADVVVSTYPLVVAGARQHAQEAVAQGAGDDVPHRLRGPSAVGAPPCRRPPGDE